jgi:hypothetical protein
MKSLNQNQSRIQKDKTNRWSLSRTCFFNLFYIEGFPNNVHLEIKMDVVWSCIGHFDFKICKSFSCNGHFDSYIMVSCSCNGHFDSKEIMFLSHNACFDFKIRMSRQNAGHHLEGMTKSLSRTINLK